MPCQMTEFPFQMFDHQSITAGGLQACKIHPQIKYTWKESKSTIKKTKQQVLLKLKFQILNPIANSFQTFQSVKPVSIR